MPKKKKDDKVVNLVPKTEEAPKELTQEEINEIMRRDEEELEGYLNKFKTVALPDSSKVEVDDEDEEEETITLDFTEDGVKAYEKKETIIVKDENGNIKGYSNEYVIPDEGVLLDKIKSLIESEKKEEPAFKVEMGGFIQDIFVSKAVASLMKKLHDAEKKITRDDRAFDGMGQVGNILEMKIVDEMYEKRQELRRAYISEWDNRIDYNKVPEWAKSYIKEYIQNMMSGLVELTERD